MRVRQLATTALPTSALAVPLSWGVPATADPKGMPFSLVCGGTSYQAVGNGNGRFTPAHDLNSTKVFIPHAFGPFTGTIRDTTGTVVDTFTDPAATQGSGKQKNDLSCNYSIHQVSDGSDPTGPPAGYTFDGSGSVTGPASP